MKRLLAVFVAAAAAALAVTSSPAAHAAAHSQAAAQAQAGKPVSIKIRVKATRADVLALNKEFGMHTGARIRPDYGPVPVNPTTRCGGFKGNIEWGAGNVGYYIDVWGKLWNNNCSGATEYLFASYKVGTACYDPQIGSASYSKTANSNINWSTDNDIFSFGYITVDVCDNHQGWSCGTAQGPGPVLSPGQCN